jgi:NAD(P)-dependent dehydrogenase (short-subunit alcohol dehydrogenase family)
MPENRTEGACAVQLTDQVAIVTGAGGGIGKGCALTLARNGARVVVVGWHKNRVDETCEQISAEGGACLGIETDISDRVAVDAMVAQVLAEYGQIDVLVNSAAYRVRGPVLDMTEDDWRRVIDVNLTGTFLVTQAVARPMIERRRGTMILFGSDRGLFGAVGGANYAASKGGVIAYGKSLALELGSHQVTVNVLNPGTIPTDRPTTSAEDQAKLEVHRKKRASEDPLGRLNTVEDIAEYVLWLASTGSRFITGQLVTVRSKS